MEANPIPFVKKINEIARRALWKDTAELFKVSYVLEGGI